MFDFISFDKERFFSRAEKIVINDICLNAHLINKRIKIKLEENYTQKGQYTKGNTPFYRMAEFINFTYKLTKKNKSHTVRLKFDKFFYKNKKDYKWFLGLEDSYKFDKKHFYYSYDDERSSFPVSYIFMSSGNNEHTKIIEMKYNDHRVNEDCKKNFQKNIRDLLKKLLK